MSSGSNSPAKQNKAPQINEETILKVSKEITVKFIEMGRVTPSTFADNFKTIHRTIKETVSNDD